MVDGVGGTVKRMVYHDVMAGKTCRNASDFAHLIQARDTSIIIEELLVNDIKNAEKELISLFDNVKAVPNIQKIHSINVIDLDVIEYKTYSNSTEKKIFHF